MAAHEAEDVMMLLVDPAALGGLAGLVVVAGWALGRAQGRLPGEDRTDHGGSPRAESPVCEGALPAAPPSTAPPPAVMARASCQQRALEERCALLARPFVLAELHAEASAIRRAERILTTVLREDALVVLARTAPGTGCRFIGLSGQPTCPAATQLSCADSGACEAACAQPSSDVSSLTRV